MNDTGIVILVLVGALLFLGGVAHLLERRAKHKTARNNTQVVPSTNLNSTLSVLELESRMRVGAYSKNGFLGLRESLKQVIDNDSQTLKTLGISSTQIANALENVLQSVQDQREKLMKENFPEFKTRQASDRIPDLYHPETIPDFTITNIPDTDIGYLIEGDLQVFTAQYRGIQECPWNCEVEPKWSSFDFLILNRQSGEWVTGPGLIVHLIRKHQFFEGLESPYRLEPARVVQVLGNVIKKDMR
jgi:hypothetical protein